MTSTGMGDSKIDDASIMSDGDISMRRSQQDLITDSEIFLLG